MVWRCRLRSFDLSVNITRDMLRVGDMFYADTTLDDQGYLKYPFHEAKEQHLSQYYFQHNQQNRKPLIVVLPGFITCCIDGMCINNGVRYGGWVVSGEAPDITVSPSINMSGLYHGFLKEGFIHDDVDGRVFDTEGRLVKGLQGEEL